MANIFVYFCSFEYVNILYTKQLVCNCLIKRIRSCSSSHVLRQEDVNIKQDANLVI